MNSPTTAAEEVQISLAERKVSAGMRRSLENLMNILQCPLCHQLFKRPMTLASCGHSFCETCIDDYNCHDSICPVEGCHMPMSVVGGGRGSFRRMNPQLAQCVESLQMVCQGLNRAPDEWWKQHNHEILPPSISADDGAQDLDSGSDSDIGDAIDLQASCGKKQTLDEDDEW